MQTNKNLPGQPSIPGVKQQNKPKMSIPPQQPSFNDPFAQQEQPQLSPEEQISAELIPIKKYHLIQKLVSLQTKLNTLNFTCDELNYLMQFADILSYDTLLIMSNSILALLGKEIQLQAKNNKNTASKIENKEAK